MRVFIALLVAICLGGCASVSVVSPDGTKITTRTLWKDVQTAEAQTENMVLSLGSSMSADQAQSMVALCILFPDAEPCSKQ